MINYGLLHQPTHADTQAAALARGSVGYAICLAVRAGILARTAGKYKRVELQRDFAR